MAKKMPKRGDWVTIVNHNELMDFEEGKVTQATYVKHTNRHYFEVTLEKYGQKVICSPKQLIVTRKELNLMPLIDYTIEIDDREWFNALSGRLRA